MPSYYTYILYSSRINKYYVGSTSDLEKRLAEHNRGKTSFAKNGMPWELKYFEVFDSRSEAFGREMQIKKRKDRSYIEALISSAGSEHPGL